MKKIRQIVEKINESKGFVSVEYIIIAGVVVALGVVITYFLATKGRGLASITGSTLDDVNSKLGGQNIGDGIKVGGNTSGNTNTSGETDSNSSQTNKSKVTKGDDGKYYQNGSLFSGTNPDDGKTYKNGEPLIGISDTDGKYYKDGVVFTGTMNGKYYKDGVVFTGTMDGKYYKDGVVFTGSINGKDYKDGYELSFTGTGYDKNGLHYTDGVEDTTSADLFEYEEYTSSTVVITKYTGTRKNVVIPGKIDGKTVVRIGEYAFSYCYPDYILKNPLNSVTIPDTVTAIEEGAFDGNNLEEVTVPGSVKTLGKYAFFGNFSLSSLVLEEGVQTIGASAFRGNDLTAIELPSTIKSVGEMAFANYVEAEDENGDIYSRDVFNYSYVDLSKLSNSVGFGATPFGKHVIIDKNVFVFWSGITDTLKNKILAE